MASTKSRPGAPSDVRGAQRPRLCHVPEYSSTAGDEAIELAALAGLHLDDWQQYVLRCALGERPDGRWSASTVGLVVGRQNGKGSVLEARQLWGLFLGGEKLLIHTAHRQKIATNHYMRVRDLIRNVPELKARTAKMLNGKGQEEIELKDGRRMIFTTRVSGNARGLSANSVFYDEAMFLTESDRSAITPTMAAQSMAGNMQIWYTGSAVDQQDAAQDGVPFTRVRESGIAGADGVAFFEWSAPGDDPSRVPEDVMRDPHMWALANPGLGIRISHEWVEHERTVEMGPRGFATERLGIGDWPDTSEDHDRVISRDAWAACAERDPANRIVADHTFAVDVNPDRTWGSIGVAGRRADGLSQFAIVDRRRRTDWIVERCAELGREYSSAPFIVLVRGPAANLIAELREHGLNVIEADGTDYGVACAHFFDAVDQQAARYPEPQPDLDEALAGARKGAQEENVWTWSRKASTSPDISPLVAVTLALWGARTQGVPTVWSIRERLEQLMPTPAPDAPEPGRTNFIPLDQMPPQRGLFRP